MSMCVDNMENPFDDFVRIYGEKQAKGEDGQVVLWRNNKLIWYAVVDDNLSLLSVKDAVPSGFYLSIGNNEDNVLGAVSHDWHNKWHVVYYALTEKAEDEYVYYGCME